MQLFKIFSLLIFISFGSSIYAAEVDVFKGMKLYAEN